MSITPSGILSMPIYALREMLSDSSAFQTWVGAGDATDALDSIHVISTPSYPTRPFALIDYADWARERVALDNASQSWETEDSSAVLYLTESVTLSEPDAAYSFMNTCGSILDYLTTVAGEYDTTRLAIAGIEMVINPTRTTKVIREDTGDYYEAAFLLPYTRIPR